MAKARPLGVSYAHRTRIEKLGVKRARGHARERRSDLFCFQADDRTALKFVIPVSKR